MNYSKVQFISWEVNTGPVNDPVPQPPLNFPGHYVGLRLNGQNDDRVDVYSQCRDIQARIEFTKNAIQQASKLADPSPNTLKVFMAPEFLYRGAGGAYLHDLLNGWTGNTPFALQAPFNQNWPGLFGGLKQSVANDTYNNWVFVFGTAISAAFPTAQQPDGKWYINTSQLVNTEVYNTALIQVGGSANTGVNYASRKHYISGIDFLQWYTGSVQHRLGAVAAADPHNLVPADVVGVPEGGAVFQLNGINDNSGNPIVFGIEICLDHNYNGVGQIGRLRTANQYVKIQLVPSSGMQLTDASIRLLPAAGPTPNSYAFNCDGLQSLAQLGEGCHTQVWNGSNGAPVPAANKLCTASDGLPTATSQVNAVTGTVTVPGIDPVLSTALWKNGAGFVRAINSLPL